ncbi:MAG: hypothetical protein WAN86_18820 [Hyphomicrobiaceae bacterium]
MTRKLLALGCAALAVLILSAVFSPADARRGGHGARGSFGKSFHGRSSSGPRYRSGPRFKSHGHSGYRHYRRHRHIYVLPPAIYYGSTYYSECGWLRRRALRTGSPYWWERYYACIDEY